MRLATTTSLALLSLTSVHALPRHHDQHDDLSSVKSWTAVLQNAWDTVRTSTLGWYDLDKFDRLAEDVFRLPDKSVYQWLADNKEYVLSRLFVLVFHWGVAHQFPFRHC